MTSCWQGPSSAFELRLLQPLPDYALDQFRQRLLYTVVAAPYRPAAAARTVLQMAFETEIGVVLRKLLVLPADVLASNVCERQRYITVDRTLQAHRYLIGPAFTALAALPDVPACYVEFLRRYAVQDYANLRVAALAAMVCMAVQVNPV